MKEFKINFNNMATEIIEKEKLSNTIIKQIILLGLDNQLISGEYKLLIERLINQQLDFEEKLLQNILEGSISNNENSI